MKTKDAEPIEYGPEKSTKKVKFLFVTTLLLWAILIALGVGAYFSLPQLTERMAQAVNNKPELEITAAPQEEMVPDVPVAEEISEPATEEVIEETPQEVATGDMLEDVPEEIATPVETAVEETEAQAEIIITEKAEEKVEAASKPKFQRLKTLITVIELRNAIHQQQPYHPLLESAQTLFSNQQNYLSMLAALEKSAYIGIRSQEQLHQSFSEQINAIIHTEIEQDNSSFLTNWLQRFITIRPVGIGTEGENTKAIIARAENMLQQKQLEKAIVELQKLTGTAAERAAVWLNKAEETIKVTNTIDELLSTLLSDYKRSTQ